VPYLDRSFSAKETYIEWLFCGKRHLPPAIPWEHQLLESQRDAKVTMCCSIYYSLYDLWLCAAQFTSTNDLWKIQVRESQRDAQVTMCSQIYYYKWFVKYSTSQKWARCWSDYVLLNLLLQMICERCKFAKVSALLRWLCAAQFTTIKWFVTRCAAQFTTTNNLWQIKCLERQPTAKVTICEHIVYVYICIYCNNKVRELYKTSFHLFYLECHFANLKTQSMI